MAGTSSDRPRPSQDQNRDHLAPSDQVQQPTNSADFAHRSQHEDPSSPTVYDEKHARPTRLDTFHSLEPAASHPHSHLAKSPSSSRADANRLGDDLELLRAENTVANSEQAEAIGRAKSRRERPPIERNITEVEETFNPPIPQEPDPVRKRDENAPALKFFAFLKKFPRFIRYLVYLIPGAALLLIPVLLGALAIDQNANPIGGWGGTKLMWFGIWLEIVWCSLWVSRMISNIVPHMMHGIAKIWGSNNAKKWKEVGQQLEIHMSLFLWLLAVLISFKPCNDTHRVPVPPEHEDDVDVQWINIVFKVIIALFVLATLNFIEKILLQWIAAAFHERTYATRIENNKGDIRQLVHLYEYAKTKLQETDSFWNGSERLSNDTGGQTPMQTLQDNARQVLGKVGQVAGKVGQVAGKVGNDFIGRKTDFNHPRKVVSELLRNTSSSHTLARLIYRSLVRPGEEMVYVEDMQAAFATPEEGEAAFNVFDKDLNGDISVDEFEAVTNEISMEKKAIAASLKDLDSVVTKLDKVFLFIIVIIVIIVFISIISGSAAAGLASAGSAVLGLAWVLQATAQEFLQSVIFVFIKHPFDVGDRVTIYGSTGANMTGDDYYVTEISLLYTEFKKLQGHVVQAPNSLLNTLFILNQRRSNGLADPVPLQIRFGTPGWMLDELKARMVEFCIENKRDFQPTILSELSAITDTRSATLTIVFIHKSNFQNELLRLARHNRFMLELMRQMHDIGIQSPYRIDPGGSRDFPMFWTGMQPPPSYTSEQQPDQSQPPAVQDPYAVPYGQQRRPSVQTSAANAQAEANLVNVADVFENRREHFQATRLASIREKNQAAERTEEAKRASESEPRGSTTALSPTQSHTAGSTHSQTRSRIFGRSSHSRTRAGHGGEDHSIV